MKPLFDKVIIKPDEVAGVSKGGIIIPDNAKERATQRGVITAIGIEVKDCEVGDRVIFGKFSGSEFEADKTTFLVMKEEDILAKEG